VAALLTKSREDTLPSTVTSVVAARLPNEDVAALHELARRFGLTISAVLSVLIARGLDGQQTPRPSTTAPGHAAPLLGGTSGSLEGGGRSEHISVALHDRGSSEISFPAIENLK
jgi:hypothetical protein